MQCLLFTTYLSQYYYINFVKENVSNITSCLKNCTGFKIFIRLFEAHPGFPARLSLFVLEPYTPHSALLASPGTSRPPCLYPSRCDALGELVEPRVCTSLLHVSWLVLWFTAFVYQSPSLAVPVVKQGPSLVTPLVPLKLKRSHQNS